jgi:hypothetical protein
MRSRALLIAVVTGVLLLAGTGGVLAYDQSRASELGKGVRIGGVDVSGLTVEQARAKLRRTVLEPLNRPVVVKAIGKRFTLPPTRSRSTSTSTAPCRPRWTARATATCSSAPGAA